MLLEGAAVEAREIVRRGRHGAHRAFHFLVAGGIPLYCKHRAAHRDQIPTGTAAPRPRRGADVGVRPTILTEVFTESGCPPDRERRSASGWLAAGCRMLSGTAAMSR